MSYGFQTCQIIYKQNCYASKLALLSSNCGKIKPLTSLLTSFKTFWKVHNETWSSHIGVISPIWPPLASIMHIGCVIQLISFQISDLNSPQTEIMLKFKMIGWLSMLTPQNALPRFRIKINVRIWVLATVRDMFHIRNPKWIRLGLGLRLALGI